jgi:biopolymer transport protein ExbD
MKFEVTGKPLTRFNNIIFINIAVLILIYFIVALESNLIPDTRIKSPGQKTTSVLKTVTYITTDGKIFLNGEVIVLDSLTARLTRLNNQLHDSSMVLLTDKTIGSELVIAVMNAAKSAGIGHCIIEITKEDSIK